jgi:hypothetical protein
VAPYGERKPLLIPLVAGFNECVKLNPKKVELLTGGKATTGEGMKNVAITSKPGESIPGRLRLWILARWRDPLLSLEKAVGQFGDRFAQLANGQPLVRAKLRGANEPLHFLKPADIRQWFWYFHPGSPLLSKLGPVLSFRIVQKFLETCRQIGKEPPKPGVVN